MTAALIGAAFAVGWCFHSRRRIVAALAPREPVAGGHGLPRRTDARPLRVREDEPIRIGGLTIRMRGSGGSAPVAFLESLRDHCVGQGWSPVEARMPPGMSSPVMLRREGEVRLLMVGPGQGARGQVLECTLDPGAFPEGWAQDPLRATCDFPGPEWEAIPRPEDCVRAFCMALPGGGGMVTYRLTEKREDVIGAYARQLTEKAWQQVSHGHGQTAWFTRRHEFCAVWTAKAGHDDQTCVTVIYHGKSS